MPAIGYILALITVGPAHATTFADAGGPYEVTAEDTLKVDAGGSDITLCLTSFFAWDLDGDGSRDTSYSTTATEDFDAAGLDGPTAVTITAFVKCTLENESGVIHVETDSATAEVAVLNADPTLDSISIPTSLDEGKEGTFTVSASDPEAADKVEVTWQFSDGYTTDVATVIRSFDDNAVVFIDITATDDDGGADTRSASVTVLNVAPTLAASPASTARVGEAYTLAPSATDPGDDELTWSLDPLPDGAVLNETTGALTWTPTQGSVGTVDLTLTVTDDDGGSDSLSWGVAVRGEDDTGTDDTGTDDTGTDDTGTDDTGPDDTGPAWRDTAHPQQIDEPAEPALGAVGCGCTTGGAPPLAALWLALLALAGWRRRRSA